MKKRFLALFLAIVMVVSLFPVTVFATDYTQVYIKGTPNYQPGTNRTVITLIGDDEMVYQFGVKTTSLEDGKTYTFSEMERDYIYRCSQDYFSTFEDPTDATFSKDASGNIVATMVTDSGSYRIISKPTYTVTATDWYYDPDYYDVYVCSEDTTYIFELTEDLVYGKTYTYADMKPESTGTFDGSGYLDIGATDATLTVTKDEKGLVHIVATMILNGNTHTITYDEQGAATEIDCPDCNGTGRKNLDCSYCQSEPGVCPDCHGSKTCYKCNGTGKCDNCNGDNPNCSVCDGGGFCTVCKGKQTCSDCADINGKCWHCVCKTCGGTGKVAAPVKYLDQEGKEVEIKASELTSTSTEWSGTVYVGESMNITGPVTLSEDVTLILADGVTLTVTGGITGSKNLTVYGQTNGTGKLIVTGAAGSSGNVGGDGVTANVTVYSGEVQVTGGKGGDGSDEAGMGGNGISGNLTVSGSGTANVTGGNAGYRNYEGGTAAGGYGVSGTVTVSGNGEATVTGGNGCNTGSDEPGFGGIGCLNLTVSGSGKATVTGGNGGTGGNNASVGGYGVMSGVSVSENGTAIITGGNGGNKGGFGTSGNITVTDQGSAVISGGNATVSGKNGANAYYTYSTIDGKVTGTNEPNGQTGGSVTITAIPTVTTWSALQEAIGNATETTTIKLTQDLKAPEQGGASINIPVGKDITLDLNGKVINANGKFNAILVEEGGKLTLIDSTPTTEHYFNVDATTGLWTLTDNETETTQTVKGGVITGGNGSQAGGVFVEQSDELAGKLTMKGGNIVGNTSSNAGGGVYLQKGSAFDMEGGSIIGNITGTDKSGGGVCLTSASFTMTGGKIEYNVAAAGGGVYSDKGTFTMTDGEIDNNTATGYGLGGGVGIGNGTFTMTGGKISGNKAATNGGGVYYNAGTINLGGTAKITGNTAGTDGTTNNLYLPNDKKVTLGTGTGEGGNDVAAPVTGENGMQIGVTTKTAPAEGTPVQITTNGAEAQKACFTPDNSGYEVAFNNDHLELVAVPKLTAPQVPTVAEANVKAIMCDTYENNLGWAPQNWGGCNWSEKTISGVNFQYANTMAWDSFAATYYAGVDVADYANLHFDIWFAEDGNTPIVKLEFYDNDPTAYITIPGTFKAGWNSVNINVEEVFGNQPMDKLKLLTVKVAKEGGPAAWANILFFNGEYTSTDAPTYKYTEYENWQIKHDGGSWEDLTKVGDGLYKIETEWKGSGFNVQSDANDIKKDWFAPEELTIGEEVHAPVIVDVYLKVIDDETVMIGVGVVPTAPDPNWPKNAPAVAPATPTVDGASIIGAALTTNYAFEPLDWPGNMPVKLTFATGETIYYSDKMTWQIYTNWDEDFYDMSEYGTLHIDIFPATGTEIKVTIEGLSADDGGQGYKNSVVKTLTAGQWNALDIALSEFPALYGGDAYDFSDIRYLILEGYNAEQTALSVGNVYFYGTSVSAYAITNELPSKMAEEKHGYIVIEDNLTEAKENDTVTVVLHPSDGYALKADSLVVSYNDGETKTCELTQDEQDSNKYTFKMPAYAVTVTAEFETVPAPTYAITNGTAEDDKETNNGYISIDKETAAAGETVTVTVTADEGYQLKSLTVTPVAPTIAGALEGVFTVSDPDGIPNSGDEKKVHFSQGNLWADVSGASPVFYFETNQYDFQSSWSTSHVSHFFWSKDASVTYAQSYSDGSANDSGVFFTNATAETAKSDFTVNGVTGKYRTLSKDEWVYLINKNDNENIRKGKYKNGVTVCEKTDCLILAPDDFTGTIEASYDATAWATAEAAGLVCLPAVGSRSGSRVNGVGDSGYYWSSTAVDEEYAYCVYNMYGRSITPNSSGIRIYGYSVRLVTEVQALTINAGAENKQAPAVPETITPKPQQDGTYQFTMPAANVTVTAEFEAVKPVDVTDGKIMSGDTVIEVKNENGEEVSEEKLAEVAEAINEVLNNEAVNEFDETGIDKATEDNNDKIVAALKNQTTDQTAKDNVTETNIDKYLNVTLVSASVDTTDEVVVTAMVFDVTPMATITVTDKDGELVTLTTKITNDEIRGTVTFLLPVDDSIEAATAAVYHEGEFLGNYEINIDGNGKYIEVTTNSFSEFGYITLDATTAGAQIGDTLYASLSDAVSKVKDNETITLLKNASGTITVSREVVFMLNLNGKTNTATIKAGSGYSLKAEGQTYTVTKNVTEPVEIDEESGKIKSGDTEIKVENPDGENLTKEELKKVAEKINEILDNEYFNEGNKDVLDEVIGEEEEKEILDELEELTDDEVAKENIRSGKGTLRTYLDIKLVSAGVDTEGGVTVTSMVFDVTPMVEITVTGKDGEPVTVTTEIPEEVLNGKVTFVLPVGNDVTEKEVALYHEGEFIGKATIKEDEIGNKYIEVETDSFGEFSYTILNDKTAGSKVGDTYYLNLADAISKVKNGETIKLMKDTDEIVVISRKVSFKIDNNGFKNNAIIVGGRGYTVRHIGNTYTVMKVVVNEKERAENSIILSGRGTEKRETNPETGAPVMNFGAIAVILGAAFVLSKKK